MQHFSHWTYVQPLLQPPPLQLGRFKITVIVCGGMLSSQGVLQGAVVTCGSAVPSLHRVQDQRRHCHFKACVFLGCSSAHSHPFLPSKGKRGGSGTDVCGSCSTILLLLFLSSVLLKLERCKGFGAWRTGILTPAAQQGKGAGILELECTKEQQWSRFRDLAARWSTPLFFPPWPLEQGRRAEVWLSEGIMGPPSLCKHNRK